jgi:hypothetical protein
MKRCDFLETTVATGITVWNVSNALKTLQYYGNNIGLCLIFTGKVVNLYL